MKRLIAISFLTFAWSISSYCQNKEMADSKTLTKWIKSDKEANRAKTDEEILVVIVKVKKDLKSEFEVWIKDVLYSALYNSKSEMKKAQLKTVRWFEPVRQNKDSTWTYSWIMDPIIPKTDYEIYTFLEKEYGKELAQKHWNKYLTFMASEPYEVTLKQTNY